MDTCSQKMQICGGKFAIVTQKGIFGDAKLAKIWGGWLRSSFPPHSSSALRGGWLFFCHHILPRVLCKFLNFANHLRDTSVLVGPFFVGIFGGWVLFFWNTLYSEPVDGNIAGDCAHMVTIIYDTHTPLPARRWYRRNWLTRERNLETLTLRPLGG